MNRSMMNVCWTLVTALVFAASNAHGGNGLEQIVYNPSEASESESKLFRAERLEQEKTALLDGVNVEELDGPVSDNLIGFSIDGEAPDHLSQQASATEKAGGSQYTTSHTGAFHNPVYVSPLGEYVYLNAGPRYHVRAKDRMKVLNWLVTDLILIFPPYWFCKHDYILVNANTGARVEVDSAIQAGDLITGYMIIDIDRSNRRICLSDGSVWSISFFDRNGFNRWLIGDLVVIGMEDGWLKKWNPNTLINVRTTGHVRGKCKF